MNNPAALEQHLSQINASAESRRIDFLKVSDLEIAVYPGLISPGQYPRIAAMVEWLPYNYQENWLEMGCGCGILSLYAARYFQIKTLAVDINPQAILCTRDNARKNRLSHLIDTRVSNVYSDIRHQERFDTIIWNQPSHNVPADYFPSLPEQGICDPGYNAMARYLAHARDHLTPGGRVIITRHSVYTDHETLDNLIKRNHFKSISAMRYRGLNPDQPGEISVDILLP